MKRYLILRNNRASISVKRNTVAYDAAHDGGTARDQTARIGIEYIALSLDQSGVPFFTIPKADIQVMQPSQLTERQQHVLSLVIEGKNNQQIGIALGISEKTVKGFVSQLLRIWDCRNRTELTAKVLNEEKNRA